MAGYLVEENGRIVYVGNDLPDKCDYNNIVDPGDKALAGYFRAKTIHEYKNLGEHVGSCLRVSSVPQSMCCKYWGLWIYGTDQCGYVRIFFKHFPNGFRLFVDTHPNERRSFTILCWLPRLYCGPRPFLFVLYFFFLLFFYMRF